MPPTAEIQRLVDQIKSSRPFESLEATQKLVELSRETERSNDASLRETQAQMTRIAEAVEALTEALLQQRPEVLSREMPEPVTSKRVG